MAKRRLALLSGIIRMPVAQMRIAIYNLHFQTNGGGERRSAALAEHLSRAHETIIFSHEPIDTAALENLFGIDLSLVENIALAGKDHLAEIQAAALHLFINNSHASELPCPAPAGIYMCMFPKAEVTPPTSYDCVTANSDFTARWICARWGIEAEVVYSACADMGPPSQKEKIILNVGRFVAPNAQNNHKSQNLLLDVFGRMPEAHAAGWELHFVGNVGGQPADSGFVRELQEHARDLPVRFHLNLELPRLRDLYQRAALYWHAKGFGFDENLDPFKHEHFGMSIIEAMSAGAVPLAFNGGGPRETITSSASGYLWNNSDELLSYTRRLISEAELGRRMSANALEASRRFTLGEFLRRMDSIIARLTTPRRELSTTCAS